MNEAPHSFRDARVSYLDDRELQELELRKVQIDYERMAVELTKTRLRLETTEQIAQVGSWERDLLTGEAKWSDQLFRIAGLPIADRAPSHEAFAASIHPDDREEALAEVAEAVAGSDRFSHEYRITRPDGEIRILQSTGEVVRDFDRRPVKVFGIAQDVTDRRLAEQERSRLWALSQQSQRLESVGKLAGGIAHDFNNLLSVILNYASFVREQLSDQDAVAADVEEIEKAAKRAADLTHQLLVFSRRDAVEHDVVDVNSAVTETARLLRRTLGENIELYCSLGDDLQPVLAGAGQLDQILVNLAVNARDAMPDGGRIEITTCSLELDSDRLDTDVQVPAGRYVELSVSDSGVGMPADVAAQAFEPFFTTKPTGKGTGLGLATVYGIVGQARGYIVIASTPGEGTEVRIYLPASSGTRRSKSRSEPRATLANGETVLVVEDEDAVRRLTERVLSQHGFHVLSADGGESALSLFGSEKVDLLLTDMVMPGMSGRELAAQVSAIRPELPILYMSGYTDEDFSSQNVAGDRPALLRKPFDGRTLLERVERALSG